MPQVLDRKTEVLNRFWDRSLWVRRAIGIGDKYRGDLEWAEGAILRNDLEQLLEVIDSALRGYDLCGTWENRLDEWRWEIIEVLNDD